MASPAAPRAAPAALLDNIVWESLAGAQARFSAGTSTARRYAPGFSSDRRVRRRGASRLRRARAVLRAGRALLLRRMVVGARARRAGSSMPTRRDIRWCGTRRSPTPIPISPRSRSGRSTCRRCWSWSRCGRRGRSRARTHELGDYFGVFEGGRLVAMAGERMDAAPWREISAVCTHPDVAGPRSRVAADRASRPARDRARGSCPSCT